MNPSLSLRLLDANSNRAREGIRTAEDYIRFQVGAERWPLRLRDARRRIAEALRALASDEELLRARGVQTDAGHPGRAESPAAVPVEEAPRQVALRGLKRAQEALRVLEEFTRGPAPDSSRMLARLRFELYEAEQWLACAGGAARILGEARLYVLLTETLCVRGLEATARAALKGGARVLQLREKALETAALLERARRLRDLCGEYEAVFVVNDRVDVALAAGAHGVHLGQGDLPPKEARRLGGEQLLIGRSTHALEQARLAVEEEGADYIAVGSMYPTATKAAPTLVGPGLARDVLGLVLPVPVFAIGGIDRTRAEELAAMGVRRVAVSTAVISAQDPERAARELVEALQVVPAE